MTRADVVRRAVRLLIVDEHDHLLLLHYLTPDTGEEFWCSPGGARDGDETDLETARREAREELGIELDGLGPCVATRVHVFRIGDGRVFEQHERFFLIRRQAFEPAFISLSDFEREAIVGYSWRPLGELGAPGSAPTSPSGLDRLVEQLLREGPPLVPLDAGA